MSFVKSFLQDEQGQDLVEYSLLLAFLGLGAVVVLGNSKKAINNLWASINGQLANADKAAKAGK